MIPFMLRLREEEGKPVTIPVLSYNEEFSCNVIGECDTPLALSNYLLATQTKTKAKQESDDQD
jgi:hypothetical protein